MSKVLAGKVALVTGAGRGLGRAFAERLAAMGCSVGIHGMRENGPAEFGEGTTLTDTAKQIGETYGVRTVRVLGDLTLNLDADLSLSVFDRHRVKVNIRSWNTFDTHVLNRDTMSIRDIVFMD